MLKPLVTIIGKSVKQTARLRGGGTALPGLVVEKIDSRFVESTLEQLPLGVVIISGTNGKTTTTKMVVELLEKNGLKVFTNRTGSNFSRGIAAALLEDMSLTGKLKADIAVLELDEAHAVNFVRVIKPKYSLILNIMRDQLDRFGEIDTTKRMLGEIVKASTKAVVLNREDQLVAELSKSTKAKVHYYGLSSKLKILFPSDKELHAEKTIHASKLKADIVLEKVKDDKAKFLFAKESIEANLKINGLYNMFNAAGALSLAKLILKDKTWQELVESLEGIEPAFGRGETLEVGNKKVEIILVKNPSGFRLALESFKQEGTPTMIAINDNYADGRDMSWLWDVDFSSLKKAKMQMISGIRAYDMALRLSYDDVNSKKVNVNIKKAVKEFLNQPGENKRIYCTYTAMLIIRKQLTNNRPLGS